MMPVLWGRASSVNVQKVLWTLAELEIEFERIDAGWTYGRTNTEDFAVMNPNRLIPVWQEEGLTLWESHAIVRHLAARRPKIIGHGPIADQWMEYVTSTLQPPFIGVFFQKVRMRPKERSEEALAAHAQALNKSLAIIDARLAKSGWLDGEGFSTAEIAMGAPMHRVFDVDWPRGDFPAICSWLDRLRKRAAYRNTVMTSYEELRA
ncbi:MAG: glutathione S-transferase family protein [Albidovulum sp.]|nr:glutathione S-transferase family protein [Albidovulum sp.]